MARNFNEERRGIEKKMKGFTTVDTLIKALEQTKENLRGREGTPKKFR